MSALSNAYAKEISALKLKKYRQSYRKFIIEGPNMIEEALAQDKFQIESIIGTSDYFNSTNIIIPPHPSTYKVSERELKKLSAMKTPYGVLAVMKYEESKVDAKSKILFYLDGIQDPGNLGTILRSADWFGLDQILLGEGTVDLYNPKTIRASMGSIFRVKGIEANSEFLRDLQDDYEVIAADMKGDDIRDVQFHDKTIIIIGNEGKGIQDDLWSLVDKTISIPQFGNKNTDSLNAAISSSIIMYAIQSKKPVKSN